MISKFLVEVKRHSVIVYHEDELSNVHYRAMIDGWDYAYQVIPARMSFNYPCDDWFKRGGMHVHYHANNQGHNVQWMPVTQDYKQRVMEYQSRLDLEKWMTMRQR